MINYEFERRELIKHYIMHWLVMNSSFETYHLVLNSMIDKIVVTIQKFHSLCAYLLYVCMLYKYIYIFLFWVVKGGRGTLIVYMYRSTFPKIFYLIFPSPSFSPNQGEICNPLSTKMSRVFAHI